MSIYDVAHVGPIRFIPDFAGGSDSVTVTVEYEPQGNANGEEWKNAWHPDVGHGIFCVSLRAWEAFQHYARSVHG